MSLDVKASIRLFGAFRNLGSLKGQTQIELDVFVPIRVSELRQKIFEEVAKRVIQEGSQTVEQFQTLFETSVLANDNEILADSVLLSTSSELRVALLPPVCGG